MGYLDNSSITVDAILTKRGRELLSRNDGSFRITQFALGDDEIDYTLFNENHPNGTQYASEAIENMPLIEAIPDGSNMMKSHLITLARGNSLLPFIAIPGYGADGNVEMNRDSRLGVQITPETHNIDNSNLTQPEAGGYKFTIVNFNYLSSLTTDLDIGSPTELDLYGGTEAIAEHVTGFTATLIPVKGLTLFPGTTTSITTTLIIEGMTTGARKTVQVIINK